MVTDKILKEKLYTAHKLCEWFHVVSMDFIIRGSNMAHRIPALAMIALEPSQINSCCTVVALESFNRGGPMATENLGVAHTNQNF